MAYPQREGESTSAHKTQLGTNMCVISGVLLIGLLPSLSTPLCLDSQMQSSFAGIRLVTQ